MKIFVILLATIIAGWAHYSKPLDTNVDTNKQQTTNEEYQSYYQCDGRQYCSQMSSYEEAKFFIQNCPNTKMDGDNDGRPCESQFRHF